MDDIAPLQSLLPPNFLGWFSNRGWSPHAHQIEMLKAAHDGADALLIAPTGGGKTLSGFLPSLIDLSERPREGLHTLYISPLKALAVDIQRNLESPVAELRLPIRTETRTGDTSAAKRQRQRNKPPQILMTTPESLALMLSYTDAEKIFRQLRCVVIDELHALAGTKRGDLLALGLARLAQLAPMGRRVGLSATVAHRDHLTAYLSKTGRAGNSDVRTILGRTGARAQVDILTTRERLPWAGRMAVHALGEVYDQIRKAGTTLVFVNTRAQAEIVFQELWKLNDDALPIALHHGSLAAEQRRKVEAAMSRGALARRGRHIVTGPWDRLGRRGPRRAGGSTQGRQPASPAHRPRQPPAGRGQPRRAGPRQPVRGAGMPRRRSGDRGAHAGRRPA